MYNLKAFYGPNAGYVLELYERYKHDPLSVDEATRAVFDSWRPEQEAQATSQAAEGRAALGYVPVEDVKNIVQASALAHAIRERGHLGAHLDPLGSEPLGDPALLPETYGLTNDILAKMPPTVIGGHAAEGASNALEAINALRAMYSGTISYEFDQVKSPDERSWLRDAVGLRLFHRDPGPQDAKRLLKRLTQVEAFERYLHKTFPGQKRFSIEGTDVLVPMLDEIISAAIDSETKNVMIGMAHRGRLSVLAHILGRPYAEILAKFAHTKLDENSMLTDSFGHGWSGDVKYHLGAEQILGESASVGLKVTLAPNPSHLEFVDPVIEGMARASQEIRSVVGSPLLDVDDTLPILIHGDAAFPGEGIVAETLNLWHLRGYWVGGTIHIIVNNQLGFTTEPSDSRSTLFASDLAKGFNIPIIHVNADDPYACLTAVRIAHAYRDQFHKDVLIDLVGYRRWGHNEGDEPAFTQPHMYELIREHPTVRELLARRLIKEGVLTEEEARAQVSEAYEVLERAKKEAEHGVYGIKAEANNLPKQEVTLDDEDLVPPPLSEKQIITYNEELLTWPKDFQPHPKLARILQRRANTLGPEGGIDWGQAEALAFASILADGTPIRLTGQDSERGTFGHRHAVLHSQDDNSVYIPLQHLSDARASFSIFNSPLSEAGVLGFEYGYSVRAQDALVLWEAQYGDFANVAQVIIDQFIAAGRAKWRQDSSLVLLLPHGYEGGGAEHSSARLERFLQLAADDNWRVANCTTAAQYFHLLRLQAHLLERYPRPLVVMTPKSLLRHPLSTSRLQDLVHGSFQPVIDDQKAQEHREQISRILLCSGKIAIDLLTHESRAHSDDTAIVRVELLYPFPARRLKQVLEQYPNAREIIWVQEEPRNMGAWSYMYPHLANLVGQSLEIKVVSRPEHASPAVGYLDMHVAEQERIVAEASGLPVKQTGGKHVH
ncbi:2-oxoglutarate dehydrogenase E1 component [Thermosporothrix hazakensis]|jgi:2-oxoglutarate dehydrogenase E1 component|uniref:oxoglutarate dehydrogenase (succinyl-transferring) n=1 Tax=Thermosporothrix hazakensis TaxID=644383 RepID=A0A326UIU0_THEHA|nr:2-oxoglutarate dehydrogenase E1 component [Thermosporothrix hazakensis]PZW32048.1 2-oxoglutarate dehydrogenase E1 component [Thermosporothrix hazakensis]GCE49624.1 2-oxoglutarate dehydrogenase E1 component [Thermosporothrix hazakensis]